MRRRSTGPTSLSPLAVGAWECGIWQFFEEEPAIHAAQMFSSEVEARRAAKRLINDRTQPLASLEQLPQFLGLS
jgi:hypothetical protein